MKEDGSPFKIVLDKRRDTRKVIPIPKTTTKVTIPADSTDWNGPAAAANKEHCRNGDQNRVASVAGNKAVCDHSDQPFPRRVYDAAADDSGCITAKSHTHGQRLFPACTAFFKCAVKVKSDAGKIP